MAFWKRKKKAEESEDTKREEGVSETSDAGVSAVISTEPPPETEELRQEVSAEESAKEQQPEIESPRVVQEDLSSGVILYGKKISGGFGKGFWGIFSIAVLPPVFIFACGILVMVCMLIFPLLVVVLAASIPVVFVTLTIFAIALPILFPLLIIFLLITGKGRLLIGSEGKWFGLEMFGKSYTLK